MQELETAIAKLEKLVKERDALRQRVSDAESVGTLAICDL